VTRGAYRLVRHPIYTALFVGLLAYILRAYSAVNLLLALVLMGLFMLKSVIEERFLRDSPDYAGYLQRVRYRWIPGVI
jgi:protein-S-isoprenylcysteine O-methyltransferase Ste14